MEANLVALGRHVFTQDRIRIPRYRCFSLEVNVAGEECVLTYCTEEEKQHIVCESNISTWMEKLKTRISHDETITYNHIKRECIQLFGKKAYEGNKPRIQMVLARQDENFQGMAESPLLRSMNSFVATSGQSSFTSTT